MTVSEALEAINKAYTLNWSDVVDELIETAGCWKNGSVDAEVVYDEEKKEVVVVQEGGSTYTPSFVYLFTLYGNDFKDVDDEELHLDLMEADFETPFVIKLGLSEEQEAGFRYLFKLFLFRVGTEREGLSEIKWKGWAGLAHDANIVENWGIGSLLNPKREITKDDLMRVYAIWQDNLKDIKNYES